MQYIALDRQKSEKIAPKSTLRTHYVVPMKLQASQFPNNAIRLPTLQTTRLRNMNADIHCVPIKNM